MKLSVFVRVALERGRRVDRQGRRRGRGRDGIVVEAELSLVVSSVVDVVAVAVFVAVPAATAFVVTITLAVPPAAIVPSEQVTVVVPLHVPWLGAAPAKIELGRKRVGDRHRGRVGRSGVAGGQHVRQALADRNRLVVAHLRQQKCGRRRRTRPGALDQDVLVDMALLLGGRPLRVVHEDVDAVRLVEAARRGDGRCQRRSAPASSWRSCPRSGTRSRPRRASGPRPAGCASSRPSRSRCRRSGRSP